MSEVEFSGTTATGIINHLLHLFVALLLLFLIDARTSRRSCRPAQSALLAVILCLLAASLLGGGDVSETIMRAVFSLSRNFALIAIYLMALDAVRRYEIAPFTALGTLRGTYELVQGFGIVLNGRLSITELPLFATANSILLVAVVVLLLVANRIIIAVFRPEALSGSGLEHDIGRSCELLGSAYHLTARETEIVKMLYRGESSRRIADELRVSVNTVRWHRQNIYEKLGIHAQQELVEKVDHAASGKEE